MGKNAKRERKRQLEEALRRSRDPSQHPQEALLSQSAIARLREAGLFIGDHPTFPVRHVMYPSGYTVILPAESGGNRLLNYDVHFSPESNPIDDTDYSISHMPAIRICRKDGVWVLGVHDSAPGPLPGDFQEIFAEESAAIDRIIDYYFDPEDQHFLLRQEMQRKSLQK